MANDDLNGNGRRMNGTTAVITYRAVVGVLLAIIGSLIWAMWQDVSSRQTAMGMDLQLMSTTLASSTEKLMDHERRIGDLETHARTTDSRIDALELKGVR